MKLARIAVLTVALGAGGFAALLVARQDSGSAPPPPAPQIATIDVLVAAADIGIGNKLAIGDVRWQNWPEAATGPFIRKSDDPDAISHLAGSIARASFSVGEPILESKLIKADGAGYMAAILPSGRRAESVEISPESGAGGFILPNDRVDVILTARDSLAQKNGIDAYRVETLLTNVRALAIDQTVEEKSGQRVVVGPRPWISVRRRPSGSRSRAGKASCRSRCAASPTCANKSLRSMCHRPITRSRFTAGLLMSSDSAARFGAIRLAGTFAESAARWSI
jgi:pilus assembly protein CpaB